MMIRVCALLVLVFISIIGLGQEQDNRPNILVIITDQHSGRVMTQSGYEYIKTPGIDKIADQGVTFTRSYVTYPVCMSSRRSFMTGLMPSKAEPPTDYPSIGSVLSENGYETVYRGKWHVGSTDIDDVSEWHGFNTYKESGVDSTVARWSKDYLKQEHDKPFFMVTSFLNPHNICEFARNMTGLTNQGYDDGAVDEQMDTAYCPPLPANFAIPMNEAEGISARRNQDPDDEHWSTNPHKGWTESQWRQYMYGYDRFLEKVDARIEEVYDELAEQGLLENTIVIYTSDHGDAHASHQWTQKMNFYEEVVNVPFVVSWKGKTKAGIIDKETLVSNGLDLYPTILKMAGIDIPDYLPGKDISAGFMKDMDVDDVTERDYVVTELDQKVYKSNTPGVLNGRMVVTKKFKYFLFDQGANNEQLFDLENDPGELHPVTYDPDYHDDLLACRAKLKEWVSTHKDDFDVDAAIFLVKYDVNRLNNGQPIITQQMFSELGAAEEGENINGPGVIRIPEWIAPENRAHPDAKYYCYFAHHDGEYIRMAWASAIEGPWHLYNVGENIPVSQRGVLDLGGAVIELDNGVTILNNHLASPDVHVDSVNQRIILYFHAGSTKVNEEEPGQRTFVSYAPFGLAFYNNIQPVLLGSSYFRVFEYNGNLYALTNDGTPCKALDASDPWSPPAGFDFSKKLWQEHPGNPFQEDITGIDGISSSDLRVRHTAVRVVGDQLHVFYSRRGDLLENIQMSAIDLSVGDWTKWDATYPPTQILQSNPGWEGGDLTPYHSETSSAPEDVNQLRDPFVFEDRDGSLYLFYTGRGEDAIGVAQLFEAHAQTNSINTVGDAYVQNGDNEGKNFGTVPDLILSKDTKVFVQFDMSQVDTFDQVVVRLFANSEVECPITAFKVNLNNWGEESITWSNAPEIGDSITTVQLGTEKKYYEWDVTDYVNNYVGDTITIAFENASANDKSVTFSSKEGEQSPEFRIMNHSADYTYIPKTPSPLFVSTVSSSEVELTWVDNAVNEEGFMIEKMDDGGNYTALDTVGANVNSYRDTELLSATEYHYRLLAFNSVGHSNYSNEAFATTFSDNYVTTAMGITEDAYVRGGEYKDDNYGSESILRVKTGSIEKYFRKTLIKIDLNTIDLQGAAIEKSVLRLYANEAESCTIIASEIDDGWSESSVTWANAPEEGSHIAWSEITDKEGFYEWDITAYLKDQYNKDGIVSVSLDEHTGANADMVFSSKEAENKKPELVLITNDSITTSTIFKRDFTMNIYPNPATNILNIDAAGADINKIGVYSLLGKQMEVVENVGNHVQLPINHYERGLYLIRVEGDFGTYIKKLIVN